jgi:hypothetical protein
MFPRIALEQIEPIALANIAQSSAVLGAVPIWTGAAWTAQQPILAMQNNTALGRVSELNITGLGASVSVIGNRATINVIAGGGIQVNGIPANAIQTGVGLTASVVSGTAFLSATGGSSPIALSNGTTGAGIVQSPGTATSFVMKGLVGLGGTTITDFGSHLGIQAPSAGVGYTHPSYTPQTFTPTLVGNTLTVAGFSRDSIGSVDTITPLSFTLPSSGGGITGIALNGIGSYTNIQFGSGFSVSGNFVNAIGAGHTIGNGALGAGIVSLPGFAASHTLKGLVGGGATTVTDMGSHILISSTGGSSSSSSVEVRKDGVTVNPMAFILNFTGAGVSVANGVGVEINIPGTSGSAGVTSLNGATGAISLIAGTNTSIANLGGGIFQFNATAGSASLAGFSGNGLSVTSNSVSLAMASLANAGAMPAWSGNATDFLNGLGQWVTPSGAGGAVNSVTSGMSSVLSVTPTTGSVIITPLGFSGTFTPSVNYTTAVLTLPTTAHSGGILTLQGTQALDLLPLLGISVFSYANPGDTGASMFSSNVRRFRLRAGTGVTLDGSALIANEADITINATSGLPSGAVNNTLRHNGTGWESTSILEVGSAYGVNVRTLGGNLNIASGGLGSNDTITVQSPELYLRANRIFLFPQLGFSYHPSLLSETRAFVLGDMNSKISFFGGAAQFKQNLPPAATDAASTQTLVNALRTMAINYSLAQ